VIDCGADLSFTADVLFIFFISIMRSPRCVGWLAQNFAWWSAGPKFGGHPKKIRGQKHAKFGSISDDFEVWQRIFPEWIRIFKVGLGHFVTRFLPRWVKQDQ